MNFRHFRGARLGPLAIPAFRALFLAQAVSIVGDYFTAVALAFAILELTGSASSLGLVLAARLVPLVLFMLAGGVWGDRLPRKHLMIASHLVRFGSQLAIAGLLLWGHASILHLAVLQVVHGAASAFFYPAATGVVPQLVPANQLQRANGLLSLAMSVGTIGGPALAGIFVALTSPGWGIAVDAMTFLIAALVLLWLPSIGYADVSKQKGFLAELSGGWREVRSRRWLWISILEFALLQFSILGAFYVLGPLVAAESLGGARSWGLVLTAFGLGSASGAILALRARPARPLLAAFSVLVAFGPCLALLAWRAPAEIVSIAAVPAGLSMSFANTVWATTLQEQIPPNVLARVASYDWAGSMALRPLGFVVAGPVASLFGVTPTLLGVALAGAMSCIAVCAIPSVRDVRRPAATIDANVIPDQGAAESAG